MPTLTDRVLAPERLDLPQAVGGLTFRPLAMADLAAVNSVIAASFAVDSPLWHSSTEELEQLFSTEGVDLARDGIVGVDADGHVLACGVSVPVPSRATLVLVILEGSVHPDVRGRGIGRAVLAWQLDRGRQQLAASGVDLPGILEHTDLAGAPSLALAARAGLEPLRYWIEMERPLRESVEVPELPAGYELFVPTPADIDDLLVAKNDSFRDHWGSQPMLSSDWRRFLEGSSSRLDLSAAVRDDSGRIAAFALVNVDPDGFAARGYPFGYVHWVGTVRDHRGRGLAPVVLGTALAAIAADGLDAAVLDVDAENPSGALGLYERLGFERRTTAVTVALQY